jgi:electron transfer flavoprotein alpha subunit
VTVLCLIEDADGQAADVSLRAPTFARQLAGSSGQAVAAAVFGAPDAVPAEVLSGYGVSEAYAIWSPQTLAGYAPQAWARARPGLSTGLPATAVVAAGTDRGQEVLAHLGAIAGLPMAANCVSAAADGPGRWQLVRHRWAGSLLKDAELEAPVALLTVAPDAAAAEPAPTPAHTSVHRREPSLSDADLVVRAAESAEQGAGVSLATARVVVGGGRGVGGPEGFAPLEELAGLLGGVLGVSRVVTSEAGGRTNSRWARPAPHLPRAVPRLRDQRCDPAHGRVPVRQAHRGGQHRCRGANHRARRLRGDRRPERGDPGAGHRDPRPGWRALTLSRTPALLPGQCPRGLT